MVKMNFLSKPVWKNFSDVKLCSFSLNKQGLGEISANVSHRRDNYYLTTLAAKDGKTLGTDSFGMYPEEKRMFDFDITTLPFFRGKFRLGELMRLISIMEMFENNLEFMELYSRETAINFHAKYGFRPDIKRFLHRDMTLKTISEDIRFEELSQKAKPQKDSPRSRLSNAARTVFFHLPRTKSPSRLIINKKTMGAGYSSCPHCPNLH